MAAKDPYIRDEIEAQLRGAGFNAQDKIYAVYYDGSSEYACGGGAWPPALPGTVAALYLHGKPPGASPCDTNPLAVSGGEPGYLQYAMIHEILHTIGIVAECAPHHTLAGHISDSPQDLMYAGDQPWDPSQLDVGRDDYYQASIPGCLDLSTSPFLGPGGGGGGEPGGGEPSTEEPGSGEPGIASLADNAVKLKKDKLPLGFACAAGGADCDGYAEAETAKRFSLAIAAAKKAVKLASASFSVPVAQTKTVYAPLTRKGKDLFSERRQVKAKVTLTTQGTGGDERVTTEALTVKR